MNVSCYGITRSLSRLLIDNIVYFLCVPLAIYILGFLKRHNKELHYLLNYTEFHEGIKVIIRKSTDGRTDLSKLK